MTHAGAGVDPNRLPWLNDTPNSVRRRSWTRTIFGLCLAVLIVASLSYWKGRRSAEEMAEASVDTTSQVTVLMPQAPAPSAKIVEPVVIASEPRVISPEPKRITFRETVARRIAAEPVTKEADEVVETASAKPADEAPPVAPPKPSQQLWPAMFSEGAAGRVARIGTFATAHKAKVGWRRIVHLYPGLMRLKAVVVPVRSARDNRTYYRLQFGTTSQAHSEVLCQRMRIVGQSCIVVGL
ncbi:MAG: hypothetical protein ACJ8EY_05985 [Sphingomicrobium sp.]